MSIRRISENDDFEFILRLKNETAKRFNPDPTFLGFRDTAEELQEKLCSPNATSKGFVVEVDGRLAAVVEVSLSPRTKNGYIEFGFVEGHGHLIQELVDKCSAIVRDNGGQKLFKFAFNKFGQVRNSEISFWEQMGFISEEYSKVTLILNFQEWKEPQEFNNAHIVPATEFAIEDIIQKLIDDGEDQVADLISQQYLPQRNPDQVVLTLLDEATNEIIGLALYRVFVHNQGSDDEFLDAIGFGLYFWPKFEISKAEKRRLLHASLLSMKQLGIVHAVSNISLKDFDTFAHFVREGFDGMGAEKNSIIHLYKKV